MFHGTIRADLQIEFLSAADLDLFPGKLHPVQAAKENEILFFYGLLKVESLKK